MATDYTSLFGSLGGAAGGLAGTAASQGDVQTGRGLINKGTGVLDRLTPEQRAALSQSSDQGPSAYNNINVDPTTREAQLSALSRLQSIYKSGGMDPQAQAEIAQQQAGADQNAQALRAGISNQMSQRGLSSSGSSFAAQQAAGQANANTANLAGMQALAGGQQRALGALQGSGALAGQMHGQDYQQASDRANAQDAISHFNAYNQTTNNQANARAQNTAQQNSFENGMQQAGAYTGQGKVYGGLAAGTQAQGAGIGGILGSAIGPLSKLLGGMGGGNNAGGPQGLGGGTDPNSGGQTAPTTPDSSGTGYSGPGDGLGGQTPTTDTSTTGGYNPGGTTDTGWAPPSYGGDTSGGTPTDTSTAFARGGVVPGAGRVKGNSPRNDVVPAMLSPGEVVVPRSVTQAPHPAARTASFVQQLIAHKKAHGPLQKFAQGGVVHQQLPPLNLDAGTVDDGADLPAISSQPQGAQISPAFMAQLTQKMPGPYDEAPPPHKGMPISGGGDGPHVQHGASYYYGDKKPGKKGHIEVSNATDPLPPDSALNYQPLPTQGQPAPTAEASATPAVDPDAELKAAQAAAGDQARTDHDAAVISSWVRPTFHMDPVAEDRAGAEAAANRGVNDILQRNKVAEDRNRQGQENTRFANAQTLFGQEQKDYLATQDPKSDVSRQAALIAMRNYGLKPADAADFQARYLPMMKEGSSFKQAEDHFKAGLEKDNRDINSREHIAREHNDTLLTLAGMKGTNARPTKENVQEQQHREALLDAKNEVARYRAITDNPDASAQEMRFAHDALLLKMRELSKRAPSGKGAAAEALVSQIPNPGKIGGWVKNAVGYQDTGKSLDLIDKSLDDQIAVHGGAPVQQQARAKAPGEPAAQSNTVTKGGKTFQQRPDGKWEEV